MTETRHWLPGAVTKGLGSYCVIPWARGVILPYSTVTMVWEISTEMCYVLHVWHPDRSSNISLCGKYLCWLSHQRPHSLYRQNAVFRSNDFRTSWNTKLWRKAWRNLADCISLLGWKTCHVFLCMDRNKIDLLSRKEDLSSKIWQAELNCLHRNV